MTTLCDLTRVEFAARMLARLDEPGMFEMKHDAICAAREGDFAKLCRILVCIQCDSRPGAAQHVPARDVVAFAYALARAQ